MMNEKYNYYCIIDNKKYYVNMAVAWLLSEVFVNYRKLVFNNLNYNSISGLGESDYDNEDLYNLHYGLIHVGLPILVDIGQNKLPGIKTECKPKNFELCKEGVCDLFILNNVFYIICDFSFQVEDFATFCTSKGFYALLHILFQRLSRVLQLLLQGLVKPLIVRCSVERL